MMNVAIGLVNMFHDISLFVCASGIDTLEDKDIAEEIGCDYLIGNFMGRASEVYGMEMFHCTVMVFEMMSRVPSL